MKNEVLDEKTLSQIKDTLLASKARLEKELGQFAKPKEDNPTDFDAQYPEMGDTVDDNAQEVAMYSDRLSLERTLEKEYADVLKALKKIEDGSYGMCKYCKIPITKARLLARPESGSCVDCKEELQSRPKLA